MLEKTALSTNDYRLAHHVALRSYFHALNKYLPRRISGVQPYHGSMADAQPNNPFISRAVELFDVTFNNRGKEHSSETVRMCLEKKLGRSAYRSHIVELFRPNSVIKGRDSVVELVELKISSEKNSGRCSNILILTPFAHEVGEARIVRKQSCNALTQPVQVVQSGTVNHELRHGGGPKVSSNCNTKHRNRRETSNHRSSIPPVACD
jgi:hypothetical protein